MNDPHPLAVKFGWLAGGARPVLYLLGLVLIATSAMMLIPMTVDLVLGFQDWKAFAWSAFGGGSVGGVLVLLLRGSLGEGLSLRQAFLLTPMSWFLVAALSSIPFFLTPFGTTSGDITNAFFESMSGITTTGSTVITNLSSAPPGLLTWRALLQWMGGIGIIAIAIAVLPALGIGGMQLFRTESSDRSEKVLPKVRQIAAAIGTVYLGITMIAAFIYWLQGMTPFEAILHSLTTISTGGYSTSDNSFGNWEANGIQWTGTLFMLAGGIPFVLYVRWLSGDRRAFFDAQVRHFVAFLSIVILAVGTGLFLSGAYDVEPAYRYAAFNIVSVVTTTGYATTDYSLWGNAAVALFFGLTFVGGCTGSTAGGIKIFRFEVMYVMLKSHFRQLLYPSGVVAKSYNGRPLGDDVVSSVVVFFAVFFAAYSAMTIAFMAMGLDFLTSASGAVTALANVGPGLGDTIGPAGNFSTLPDLAKWLMSFGMILGRLELFTVLILFYPRFWRS